MIVRHYVQGMKVDGLDVSTQGLQLNIAPGTMEVPGGKVTLTEPVALEFAPADVVSDIQIGFDGLGRLYVDRNDRGESRERAMRFGVLTHYIYFALPPDATDLAGVAINVLHEPIASN